MDSICNGEKLVIYPQDWEKEEEVRLYHFWFTRGLAGQLGEKKK